MTGFLLLAAAFNVGSLLRVEHLDCEVSTNVVLATLPKMSEMLYLYLATKGITNSVINGRIELRRSGDILVATNGVE